MHITSIRPRYWSQFAKIYLLTLLVLVGTFTWLWYQELPNITRDIIRERSNSAHYPIEVATSVLELYRVRAEKGEIPLQAAQKQALLTLKDARYAEGKQYFWIHDLGHNMLMHPHAPDLVGTNVAEYADVNGLKLFSEMNRLVEQQGKGTIEYHWPRPGSKEPEQKLTWVTLYKPWGWVIGSGIYLEDVNHDVATIKQRVIFSAATGFILITVISALLVHRINRPLRKAITFAQRVNKGESLDEIETDRDEEDGLIITVMKALVSDLKRSERLLNETSHIARLGGWELHLDTGKLRWTREVYAIHDVGEEFEPTIERTLLFYTADDLPVISTAMERCRSFGTPFDLELQMRTANGRNIWVRTIGQANTSGGAIISVSGVIQDITPQKELEAQREALEENLIQAHKFEAIGRLAGGVAHEFNNILQAIAGYTELLELNPSDSQREQCLEGILISSRRAAELTKGLLAYSAKQIFMLRTCDLNGSVLSAADFLTPLLSDGISVAINLHPAPLTCRIDANQIQQVIVNLGANARDAMTAGDLEITTSVTSFEQDMICCQGTVPAGHYATLAVRDTGPGIAPELLDHIYDPFFSTKQVGKGPGLGLSVVKGVVTQHRGYICCDSKIGTGTTFWIYLPLEKAGQPNDDSACPGASDERLARIYATDFTRRITAQGGSFSIPPP